ncbi:START domain-containing protein [Fulvivirga sedimenti]|uniref:START domain-containing protein n=1 Tax=Fulvivirga sedimenti TaxID=2879465 RepID=A0A9X1HX24_9BACT|nr:START domain-containing protein [Fulvivirga sedimenti]MCA6079211.1 hypothetical protein [Fulvivirga sedimenti]
MIRLVIILIVPTLLSFQENEWRLDKDKNEIQVYTREVEGFPIRQFRASSQTSAPLEAIEQLFREISDYPSWMPDVSGSQLLEQPADNAYIYYLQIDSPFPVQDRDLVARMTFEYLSENVLRITYENLPDHYPAQSRHTRITYFKGYWEFTRAEGQTIIQNQFLSDPGGSVPSWVVNSFMASNPYNTVLALKKQIE